MRLILMEYKSENLQFSLWRDRRRFSLDSLWKCSDESSDAFSPEEQTFYTLGLWLKLTISDISISIIIESIQYTIIYIQ